MPVDSLLKSLQPPKDIRVAPIEIDFTVSRTTDAFQPPAGSELKLVAEAASALDMTRYVNFLAERPTIAHVHLLRHEILASEPARPYRGNKRDA
jgi:hypothetical protein